MSTVPQWNADIITPDVDASAEIISGGGLEKDQAGAIGVNVDNETIVINQDGELEATLSDRDSAYVATYNVTTYQEISAAHTAGKAIFLVGVSGALSAVMPMTSFSVNPAMAIFMLVIGDVEYQAKIDQGVWSVSSASLQADWNESNQLAPSYIANKPTVDQIYDGSSTNAQSGTAVAGAIAGVRQVPSTQSSDEGKVLGVTDSSGTLGWVDDSVDLVSNGGLEKNSSGAIGVKVDNASIVLDDVGEIKLADMLWSMLNIEPHMPTEIPAGSVRIRYRSKIPGGITADKGVYYADNPGVVDLLQSQLSATAASNAPVYLKAPNYFDIIGGVLTAVLNPSQGRICKFIGSTGLVTISGLSLASDGSAYNCNGIFKDCTSLESVSMDTTGLQNASDMFMGCTSLKAVPLLNTATFTKVGSTSGSGSGMFWGCTAVESGALALYQQMSTQATPPVDHVYCFSNCGSGTTTGAAELAQIPTSWGGTMA